MGKWPSLGSDRAEMVRSGVEQGRLKTLRLLRVELGLSRVTCSAKVLSRSPTSSSA